jgi:Fe-Mn family superoxide dismutase
MTYTQQPLPYAYDALEPHIDARTMEIHYSKHHAGYIKKLNASLEAHPEVAEKTLEELLSNLEAVPADIRTSVRNNGGGHWAHTLFWKCMSPNGGGKPEGALMDKINESFGSFEDFQTALSDCAAKTFGSGWAWLVQDKEGKLKVYSTGGHDTPLEKGETAILVIDVWEHAYYLNYQNRRVDYIGAYWNLIDWKAAAERMQ